MAKHPERNDDTQAKLVRRLVRESHWDCIRGHDEVTRIDSAKDVGWRQRRRSDRLLSALGYRRTAGSISNELRACSALHPCFSGACLRCGTALRRGLCRWGLRVAVDPELGFTAFSWAPSWMRAKAGALSSSHLKLVRSRADELLRKAGVTFALAGIRVFLFEDRCAKLENFFALQVCGIFVTDELHCALPLLKANTSVDDDLYRPFNLTTWEGDLRALALAWEPDCESRLSILDVETSERISKPHFLRSRYEVEFAIAAHRAGLASRSLLIGAKLVDTPDGVAMVRRRSKGK